MNNGKGLSIAALVCGILGIVGSFIPFVGYFTLVLAILGIIFGVIGMKKCNANGGEGKGLAVAGLVLGIIGAAFGVIGVICIICAAGIVNSAVNSGEFNDALNSLASQLSSVG
jgi:hypothetical protein